MLSFSIGPSANSCFFEPIRSRTLRLPKHHLDFTWTCNSDLPTPKACSGISARWRACAARFAVCTALWRKCVCSWKTSTGPTAAWTNAAGLRSRCQARSRWRTAQPLPPLHGQVGQPAPRAHHFGCSPRADPSRQTARLQGHRACRILGNVSRRRLCCRRTNPMGAVNTSLDSPASQHLGLGPLEQRLEPGWFKVALHRDRVEALLQIGHHGVLHQHATFQFVLDHHRGQQGHAA